MMISLPRLLNAGGNEVRRLHPMRLSISENAVPLSTAQMAVSASETVPGRSYVELFTVCGSVGIFRTKTPQTDCGNPAVTISLEHAVCEIGDWIINAEITQAKKTLSQALTQVFGYYRGTKWQLGTVSASGDVVINEKYSNVLTAINGLVSQIPNAIMTFNFSTSPWTLNVVPKDTTVTAEGRLSRNVQSARITKDETNLCTRVYMEGLGTGGAVGYRDADTAQTYGIIEKYVSGSGYTAEQAEVVAAQYLAQNKNPKYTVDIGILDLHTLTGEEYDKIRIGKLFRLVSPEENITVTENIISINWSDVINAPLRATVKLAHEEKSLVTFLQQTSGDIYNSYNDITNIIGEKDKEYWTKFELTDRAIEAEATRARTEEGKRIAKTEDFDTVAKIIADAHAAADAAAISAKNASIARTNVYQTAEAIVTAAVTTGQTQGDGRWIKQTSTIQTADALISTAVAQGQTAGDGRYLRQTQVYQTADSIVSTAKSYTDTQKQSLQSEITQMYNKISLVVSDNNTIDSASIVAAINESGSSVSISASKINLTGHVSITDLSEWKTNTQLGAALDVSGGVIASSVKAGALIADNSCVLVGWQLSWQSITINGTSYRLAVGS